MKQGFRQSMAWLHNWAGLLFGWLLFVIFACGTSAYFQDEITRWMQPEVTAAADPSQAADGAVRWLDANAPGSTDWFITLPSARAAVTTLFWTPAPDAPEGAANDATLDGAGRAVDARKTAGGYFLYRFHYDLHYLPVIWARYLVGVAAMFMLVALISGIVTHKKIFADFFMLRFGKGQRSWLDAHNVTAVLALPFHLMITYTGLVSLDTQFAPAPIAALYASEDTFFGEAFPLGGAPEPAGRRVALAPLAPMIVEADRRWGGAGVGYIFVQNPGDAAARVTLTRAPGGAMNTRGETLQFDGASGRPLVASNDIGAAQQTEGVMIGLHAGRFADTALRWLYFVSGLGGTVMIGTGLILWTVKRRAKLPDPARPHLGFRIVERLNIATLLGFPIGLAVYFLANRLLPIGLDGRPDWEIDGLFIAWAAAALIAAARPARRAWIELSMLCALLFAAVPAVSAVTTERNLIVSLAAGDWVFAGFDLTMLAIAALFALAGRKAAKRLSGAALRTRDRRAVAA